MPGCESEQVSLEDLFVAFIDCRRRKKGKKGAKSFTPYAFHTLSCLRDEMNERRYQLKRSQCFVVKYPVPREVFCAAFRDRIVQHFVYNELNPVIERLLIENTASCRKGKGTDFAIQRCARFVRRETGNYTDIEGVSYGKFDLTGFFMSIDREKLLRDILFVVDNIYTGKYKDVLRYLLPIIILTDVTIGAQRLSPISDWDMIPPNKTLFGNTRGLPIGNITSQLFANFYLNGLDHILQHRHRSYVRYVDDIVIIDRDRKKIEESKRIAINYLSTMGMRLNVRKSIIGQVRYGVEFLGVKVYPYYSVLGRRRIGRLWYTSRKFDSADKAFLSCASRKGMLNRYHGKRISERWYQSLPDEWKGKMKMDSDAHFHLLGKIKVDKDKLRDICLCGAEKEQTCTMYTMSTTS